MGWRSSGWRYWSRWRSGAAARLKTMGDHDRASIAQGGYNSLARPQLRRQYHSRLRTPKTTLSSHPRRLRRSLRQQQAHPAGAPVLRANSLASSSARRRSRPPRATSRPLSPPPRQFPPSPPKRGCRNDHPFSLRMVTQFFPDSCQKSPCNRRCSESSRHYAQGLYRHAGDRTSTYG